MKTEEEKKIFSLAEKIFGYLLFASALILGGRALFKESKNLRSKIGPFVRNPIKNNEAIKNEGSAFIKKAVEFKELLKSYFHSASRKDAL